MQNLKRKAVQIPRNFPAKVKKTIRKAPCRKVYPPFPGHLRRQETLSFDTPEIISFSRRDVKRSGKQVLHFSAWVTWWRAFKMLIFADSDFGVAFFLAFLS